MKKYLFLLLITAIVFACNKTTTLPNYTPPITKNLIVKSFAHVADTVNVGDTIYLTATGTAYDSLNLYGYFSIVSSATGSPVYTVGSSSSPVLLPIMYATKNATDTNQWVATIALPKLTNASNSKLTITGNFFYPLSLSSQGTNLVTGVADAGQKTKTIYIE
jgi:hypothetical protein